MRAKSTKRGPEGRLTGEIRAQLTRLIKEHGGLVLGETPASARRLGGERAQPHHLKTVLDELVHQGAVVIGRERNGDYRQSCSAHEWQPDVLHLIPAGAARLQMAQRRAQYGQRGYVGLRCAETAPNLRDLVRDPAPRAPSDQIWDVRQAQRHEAEARRHAQAGYPQSPRPADLVDLAVSMTGGVRGRAAAWTRWPQTGTHRGAAMQLQLGRPVEWSPEHWNWVRRTRPLVNLRIDGIGETTVRPRGCRRPGTFRLSRRERQEISQLHHRASERDADVRMMALLVDADDV